jgi:glycosyltransferase involved in cell wall biosynthesis
MTRVSVLYVSPVAQRGGAETVLLNILKWQDRDRFRPLVCLLNDGPFADELRRVVDDVHVFPARRLRSVSTLPVLVRLHHLIQDNNVDVVFNNMAMGQVYGSLAAIGTPAKAMWFQHGIIESPDLVDRLAVWLPAAVTMTPSSAAARAQTRLNGSTPVRIIREGIDTAMFDPARHRRGALRRELAIDADVPIFATIGRLQRSKGHSRFLEVAVRIVQALPEAHFVVVGGSLFGLEKGYEEELRVEADRLLPKGRAHFLGHRDDVPAVLADVDLLLQCPLAPESFGLAIVEAMAMRVPVLSIRAWGPAETVDDGQTGVLVDRPDADRLAEAAVKLWRDPAGRAALGLAARRRVEQRFTVQQMVADVEAELERVAGHRAS